MKKLTDFTTNHRIPSIAIGILTVAMTAFGTSAAIGHYRKGHKPAPIVTQQHLVSTKDQDNTSTLESTSSNPQLQKAVVAPTSCVEGSNAPIEHLIVKGESLWKIAGVAYGKPWQYPVIATYNSIENANLIYAGTTITIPCGTAAKPVRTATVVRPPTPRNVLVAKTTDAIMTGLPKDESPLEVIEPSEEIIAGLQQRPIAPYLYEQHDRSSEVVPPPESASAIVATHHDVPATNPEDSRTEEVATAAPAPIATPAFVAQPELASSQPKGWYSITVKADQPAGHLAHGIHAALFLENPKKSAVVKNLVKTYVGIISNDDGTVTIQTYLKKATNKDSGLVFLQVVNTPQGNKIETFYLPGSVLLDTHRSQGITKPSLAEYDFKHDPRLATEMTLLQTAFKKPPSKLKSIGFSLATVGMGFAFGGPIGAGAAAGGVILRSVKSHIIAGIQRKEAEAVTTLTAPQPATLIATESQPKE